MHKLRAILWEEIENLRSNKTTPMHAYAVSHSVGKILTSIKLEMDYAKLTNRMPDAQFLELPDKPAEQ
jgi:hypothetical protein